MRPIGNNVNRATRGKVFIMSSSAAFRGLSLHEQASALLPEEINEIVSISLNLSRSLGFLKERLKTAFPKRCAKCSTVFESFEDFFYRTEEITSGTVTYPILGQDFYMHRNCLSPCDTTLIVVFEDRRDETAEGMRRRELFEECISTLRQHLEIDEVQVRDVLLAVLAISLVRIAGNILLPRRWNPHDLIDPHSRTPHRQRYLERNALARRTESRSARTHRRRPELP